MTLKALRKLSHVNSSIRNSAKAVIENEERRIQGLFDREYVDPTGKTHPIHDGVADLEGYLASSPRIMWILKEPYDDFNENGEPVGGGWSYTKDRPFNSEIDITSQARVFQPICYINYGIWKAVHDWKSKQMPELGDCPEMRNGLRKIAYVNVSKLPAGKGSPSARIEEAYQKYRTIILDQIRTYSPELIFACPPHVSLLLKDLGGAESQWKDFGSAASVRTSSKQRLVRVAHPSQRTTERADYVNDAISAATADL